MGKEFGMLQKPGQVKPLNSLKRCGKMKQLRIPRRRDEGFTLIELLIVIAIILILIAIALPNFLSAQLRAKVTKARGCLQTYRTAQEAYFTDFNQYPPDVDGSEVTQFPPYTEWRSRLTFSRGGRCNSSEICTFMLLTSPIAYVRDLCKEPFIGEFDDGLATGNRKDVSYFEYGTYLSGGVVPGFRNTSRANYIYGKQYGLQYVMISLGPDTTYNFNYGDGWQYLGSRNYFGLSPAYNPTNGTKSSGDLIVSNRGHEG